MSNTTPLSNADELRKQIAVREKIDREVEEILGDFLTGSLRLALVNGIDALITSQKAIGKEEAYCDVGNYATDTGDTKLLDFVDTRIAQLSTEDVKES